MRVVQNRNFAFRRDTDGHCPDLAQKFIQLRIAQGCNIHLAKIARRAQECRPGSFAKPLVARQTARAAFAYLDLPQPTHHPTPCPRALPPVCPDPAEAPRLAWGTRRLP